MRAVLRKSSQYGRVYRLCRKERAHGTARTRDGKEIEKYRRTRRLPRAEGVRRFLPKTGESKRLFQFCKRKRTDVAGRDSDGRETNANYAKTRPAGRTRRMSF